MDLQVLKTAAKAALEKKASQLAAFDLTGKSDLCDLKLVVSADNDRQTRAIADAIEAALKEQEGLRPASIEGKNSGYWILMDYGDFIVHIFHQEYRQYYAVDSLWVKSKITI